MQPRETVAMGFEREEVEDRIPIKVKDKKGPLPTVGGWGGACPSFGFPESPGVPSAVGKALKGISMTGEGRVPWPGRPRGVRCG